MQQHSPCREPIFQTPTLLSQKRGHIGIDKYLKIGRELAGHKWCINFTILLIRTLWREPLWYTHTKHCVDVINLACCLHSLTNVKYPRSPNSVYGSDTFNRCSFMTAFLCSHTNKSINLQHFFRTYPSMYSLMDQNLRCIQKDFLYKYCIIVIVICDMMWW